MTYADAGVDQVREARALPGLVGWLAKANELREGVGTSVLPSGHYATVVDIGQDVGLALATDGVGTKVLVAQLMGKYDTVGIDCIAMNVNDLVCVGAEPIAMVDYLAVEEPDEELLEGIGKGLYEGAVQANITIPGGEIAQLKEIVKGAVAGKGFDLAGAAFGLVPLDGILTGEDIGPGDAIVGLASSGIHSNGLTLARKALLEQMDLAIDSHVEELGRTVGEELLEPTRIYVRLALEILRSDADVKGLANITSDGLLNLLRLRGDVDYVIKNHPEPPPIFALIQRAAGVTDEEMYAVFNMGVGFCVVCADRDAGSVLDIARAHGIDAWKLGAVQQGSGHVALRPVGLVGQEGEFRRA
ncbi:MAG: phosphoribosylformylglycinamidine cyclo-ligase [Armatimonadota bacterium]